MGRIGRFCQAEMVAPARASAYISRVFRSSPMIRALPPWIGRSR